MAKRDKSARRRRRRRKKRRKAEERSDRRTAEFLVRRLDEIQTDLGDLIPDLQTFDDYQQVTWVSCCVRILQDVRKKYEKRAAGNVWEEE